MNKAYIPLAMLLIGIGLFLHSGQPITVPDGWNPLNWIHQSPASVCIIESTKDRDKLQPEQVALLESTTFPKEVAAKGGEFLGCFDSKIVDRDKKPPAALVPYLAAAEKLGTLPALVTKRGSRVTAVALPANETEAKKCL